jgi:hypothetical protein
VFSQYGWWGRGILPSHAIWINESIKFGTIYNNEDEKQTLVLHSNMGKVAYDVKNACEEVAQTIILGV